MSIPTNPAIPANYFDAFIAEQLAKQQDRPPMSTESNIVERARQCVSKEAIQRGVLAALGCVKLDYRSPKRLDEAAGIIADFVAAELNQTSHDPQGVISEPKGNSEMPGRRPREQNATQEKT